MQSNTKRNPEASRDRDLSKGPARKKKKSPRVEKIKKNNSARKTSGKKVWGAKRVRGVRLEKPRDLRGIH